MAQQVYRLPDGREAVVDPANPAHMQWVTQQKGELVDERSFGERALGLGKALGSGLAEGAARLPFLGSDLLNLGLDVTQKKLNPEWMRDESAPSGQPINNPVVAAILAKIIGVSPEAIAMTPTGGPSYADWRKAHKGSGVLDEGLEALGTQFYRPQGTAEKYLNIAAQGAGGGAATSVPRILAPAARTPGLAHVLPKITRDPALIQSTAKAATIPQGVAGATGAVTGQGLMDATGSQNPLVGLVGNILGGGLTGWAAGRTSKPSKMLGEAAQAVSPADWRAARANIDLFNRPGGPRTATLGEAFPGESPLLGITQEASAQAGNNALIRKMVGREADLQQQTSQALDSLGPWKSGDVVAARAEDAARQRLEQFRESRTSMYTRRLEGANPLEETDVMALYTTLKMQAKNTESKADRAAIEAVMDTLLKPDLKKATTTKWVKDPNGGLILQTKTSMVPDPKTDLGTLARDLKRLQKTLEYNPRGADTPTKLDAHALAGPYRLVNDFLHAIAPNHYSPAERGFRRMSENLVTPAEKGALGILAGNEGRGNLNVPVTRLNAVMAQGTPQSIPQLLRSLQAGAPDDPNLISDIARTLLQQRVMKGGPNQAAKLMGGTEMSPSWQQTSSLIGAVGNNSPAFMNPMQSVDLLSRISSAADRGGAMQRMKDAGTSAFTLGMSPFQDLWVRGMLAARKANYRDVAHLLARPTRENLAILERLAKSDPALRLQLSLGGGILGAGNSGLPPEE